MKKIPEYVYPNMDAEIVHVKQGKLSGMIKGNAFGCVYKAYLGIPYAAPPIGKLRFKDPEPPACWTGVRYAKNMRYNMSAQLEKFSETIVIGSEDCLYLNVYVPYDLNKSSAQKSVMVWIHGGFFLRGNGNIEDTRPDYFMNKDVIMVSINYRLGVLGFLNLEDEETTGNQGLKDQVAALKWIKENIKSFGGDPDNITVFGCGTGAISAHLLMISPLSKDLFHKAILQSGVALCPWAIRKQQPEAFKLALLLGCKSTNPKEIAEFLRKCPYEILVRMEFNVVTQKERHIKKIIFGPTIDKKSRNSFLPTCVTDLFDNRIPILLGHTSHEYLGYLTDFSQESLDEMYADLPLYMENIVNNDSDDATVKIKQIETYYMRGMQFSRRNLNQIIRFMSDLYYGIPIRSVAYLRSLQTNVKTYLYYFEYNGTEAKLIPRPNQHFEGVSHEDELIYLFYLPRYKTHNNIAPPNIFSRDHNMINMITSMWSGFAKFGHPNIIYKNLCTNWVPVEKNGLHYFCFGDNHSKLFNQTKILLKND
ncbi:esterase E4-like isoform X2 [Odontomachus brunneus]|uniref:esterase E4-like isoform X2 n=1 Tax=Odontomachus brunneus TaxID=486640 RepID=UPI0013F2A0CA|nr:esterase E4-like isoform X2 [Odontomachus brunneus]